MKGFAIRCALAGMMLLAAAAMGRAQLGDMNGAAKPSSFVRFDAEPQTVAADRMVDLALRFQVVGSYHINSHTPRSEFLIPTTLKVESASGVALGEVLFPAGHAYSFPFDPGEKVDVYSGNFVVKVRVRAAAGEHTVNATLRYQACDNASCYPPKTLPVQITFTAK